jgi:hypothetical protein
MNLFRVSPKDATRKTHRSICGDYGAQSAPRVVRRRHHLGMDTRRRSPPGRSYSRTRAGRRFADFIDHLRMPRAGSRRLFRHAADGWQIDEYGRGADQSAPAAGAPARGRCFRGVLTAWDLPVDAPVRGRRERPMRTALDEEASQRIACHSGTGLLSASVVSVRRSRSEWEIWTSVRGVEAPGCLPGGEPTSLRRCLDEVMVPLFRVRPVAGAGAGRGPAGRTVRQWRGRPAAAWPGRVRRRIRLPRRARRARPQRAGRR